MCLKRRRNGFYHQNLQNMLPMLIYFFRKLKNAITVISVYKWNKTALWLSILRECFFSTQRNFKTGNLPSSSSGAEKRQLHSSSSSLWEQNPCGALCAELSDYTAHSRYRRTLSCPIPTHPLRSLENWIFLAALSGYGLCLPHHISTLIDLLVGLWEFLIF